MTVIQMQATRNRGMGNTTTTAGATYTEAGAVSSGGADTGVGIVTMYRWGHQISQGATINNATLRIPWSVKDGAQNHSATHVITAHAHGNSPRLVHGAVENTRTKTTASVTWNATWTANVTTGTQVTDLNVTSIVQEIVNRGDFQPGGYITFIVTCTAETNNVNLKFYNAFDYNPYCRVTFTENPAIVNRHDVNTLEPGLFTTGIGQATDLEWFANALYGYHTDGGTGQAFNFDPSMRRINARGSMRFTAGTPSGTKNTGAITAHYELDNAVLIFFGWIYVPSYINVEVNARFMYNGGTATIITARDQWVPFCTIPGTPGGGGAGDLVGTWPGVEIKSPFQQGWQFWLADCGVMRSKLRQYPFEPNDDIPHQGISTYATNGEPNATQTVRQSRCRMFVHDGTAARPRPTYTRDSNGFYIRSETRKGP